jgi:uncharacterized protein YaaN involved in tellurite resistance
VTCTGPTCWRSVIADIHRVEQLEHENRELRRIANEALAELAAAKSYQAQRDPLEMGW